ncbi:D-tyrosyl-tRNA(Tyr) deacylase [Fusibacter paucivorans]|uniref:D-aminoacyl-tRNA deacylase n=1 Tax=Fusibacter paucivorans TaxID=76009 RepID=A0ABS5PRE6_9FIRM|nr:D-aminoacyl-tRNA deacylase [Fusibacter paucivorans]MBS7527735.1 D-tyrosyl-tRNA(Tyr) deacylase [Fusibacter paucivorans]
MRAVVQRVKASSVVVDDEVVGAIGKGINVLLGVEDGDTEKDVTYMVEKICNLRIFEDEADKLNQSLMDIQGEMLCISQFTLLGDCRKGRRPSFTKAARPEAANDLYEQFVEKARMLGVKVETGVFQTYMHVDIQNDGPITILVDSHKQF